MLFRRAINLAARCWTHVFVPVTRNFLANTIYHYWSKEVILKNDSFKLNQQSAIITGHVLTVLHLWSVCRIW